MSYVAQVIFTTNIRIGPDQLEQRIVLSKPRAGHWHSELCRMHRARGEGGDATHERQSLVFHLIGPWGHSDVLSASLDFRIDFMVGSRIDIVARDVLLTVTPDLHPHLCTCH